MFLSLHLRYHYNNNNNSWNKSLFFLEKKDLLVILHVIGWLAAVIATKLLSKSRNGLLNATKKEKKVSYQSQGEVLLKKVQKGKVPKEILKNKFCLKKDQIKLKFT